VAIGTILLSMAGCNRDTGPDPAAANLAPAEQSGQAVQEPYSAVPPGEQLAEAPQPPPALPAYRQPPCPGENYIWTPGYWAYETAGYYWVPGAWVLAPYVDALWTPPYWDYEGGRYRWHHGYWGRYVGYYGGINYGFGYTGLGYGGGYWDGPVFVYNRSVSNIDTGAIRNYYRHSVTNYTPSNRIAYNGPGGVTRAPMPAEAAAAREGRIGPLPAQSEHMRQAAGNRGQFAASTRGRPQVPALERPLATLYREPAAPPAEWRRQAAPRESPFAAPGRGEASRMERPEFRPGGAPNVERPGPQPQEAPGQRFGGHGRGEAERAIPQAEGHGRGHEGPQGGDRKK
jgi:hypothetical protein